MFKGAEKMKKILILAGMMAMILGFSIQAQASLRGYQFIFDTDLDITWYDYANASGTWQNHIYLVSGLIIDIENTTYDDLRLPSTSDILLSYTSETELSDSPGQEWSLSFYIGQQLNFTKNVDSHGISIRNVDVATVAASEPISSTIGRETIGFAFHKSF
jgi:hypothetical protein